MRSLASPKNYKWIASLYFFQSMPYVVVTLIATIVYQQYGMSNTQAAFLTSLFMLPWTIKPLFAPFLEHLATKKKLTLYAQAIVTLIFILLAFCVENSYFLVISSVGFAGLAFISSLHDIVSDGIYLLNLNNEEQKKYVALRSFFYQMGRLIIKGGLLAFIGSLAVYYELNVWQIFFFSLSVISFSLTFYHKAKIPEHQTKAESIDLNYYDIFKTLLFDTQIYPILFFIFIYNFSEAQMQKIIPLFLLDKGGLGLNLSQVGQLYGIIGGIFLMLGIFVSGWLITRYSFEKCLKNVTLFLLLGHLLYLLFPFFHARDVLLYLVILLNQSTVGLANGTYMGYLLIIANRSNYPMSMYTVCTSIMASSYVFFGAISGWMEQKLGYSGFFLYIFAANTSLLVITRRTMNKYD
ncbi:MFS transporter [Fluoribacter gormanii]|uniref:MFS transporter, PAT family, beta-lactamase induction signal transducer AmpG n=1 Tax=Fluoribacter gormanii TaxID=464 RepID=A0A377GLH4_9GAMM|nr:MFS transporter [Fluoribacter gormanii]KTD01806.1 beta lactamase induction signal transducer AmpG [Fluoribacter gormanii]SIR21364.1 MFS transporter, PAT family, beta-lactamase induction signal transducer AmpG [Fluoribacter gormanii]STO25423.1 siderophore transporter, RhtX/FptX family [Fluoribacter gormanii]